MGRGRKEIVEDGKATRFSSTYQPARAGRKPNIYKQAAEASGFSKQDMEAAITMMLNMTSDEINSFQSKSDTPIWMRNVARSIIEDTRKNRLISLNSLLDRVFGRDTQRVEVTGANGADLIPARVLTKEESKDLFESMEKEY